MAEIVKQKETVVQVASLVEMAREGETAAVHWAVSLEQGAVLWSFWYLSQSKLLASSERGGQRRLTGRATVSEFTLWLQSVSAEPLGVEETSKLGSKICFKFDTLEERECVD